MTTPQRHSHTGPGDGGDLDLATVKSDTEAVYDVLAEGTATVPAESGGTPGSINISTGITDATIFAHAAIAVVDESDFDDTTAIAPDLRDPQDGAGDLSYRWVWNGTEWLVQVKSDIPAEANIKWKFLELTI